MCFSAQGANIIGDNSYRSGHIDMAKVKIFDFEGIDVSKVPSEERRFYPKWWTRVLRKNKEHLEFRPIRYQLLPHFCKEKNCFSNKNTKTHKK